MTRPRTDWSSAACERSRSFTSVGSCRYCSVCLSGPSRFQALLRDLPGFSHQVLTESLRQMEADKFGARFSTMASERVTSTMLCPSTDEHCARFSSVCVTSLGALVSDKWDRQERTLRAPLSLLGDRGRVVTRQLDRSSVLRPACSARARQTDPRRAQAVRVRSSVDFWPIPDCPLRSRQCKKRTPRLP